MAIWYVYQNQTFKEESAGEYLWSPQKTKAAGNNTGYMNMAEVKKGDIIFHGCNAHTVAISIAKTNCFSFEQPKELATKNPDGWNEEGFRVNCHYFVFSSPLDMKPLRNWLAETHEKETAFNVKGSGNQRYLCKLNKLHAERIVTELLSDPENDNATEFLHKISATLKLEDIKLSVNDKKAIEEKIKISSNFLDRIERENIKINLKKVPIPEKRGEKSQKEIRELLKKDETKKQVRRKTNIDYLAKYVNAEKLGRLAEEAVLEYEKEYLIEHGRSDLVEKIVHISKVVGDQEGYDIKSFDLEGKEKYIEVKATGGQIDTPFFITRNEIETSKKLNKQYWLYRVFNFSDKGKTEFYAYNGVINDRFDLIAEAYKAYL